MLKWTASSQRLNELPAAQPRLMRRQRRQRRATIANKENVPGVGYTSTPMPLARVRNSPLVLAPLSDIRNVTPESKSSASASPRRMVQSVRYATTLPRYEEEYSPSGVAGPLPSGQHLALRGLLPLDPFLEQPRYISANNQQLRKRKLESDFVATMEEAAAVPVPVSVSVPKPQSIPQQQQQMRPVTPQPSQQMGDQTLDKLIDAILDSACKADASSKKKPRKSFNLRRRTLVKQQMESECAAMLSPSYAPGDDPASDLSFALLPLPATPEPASPLKRLPHSLLLQFPTPQPVKAGPAKATAPDTPTAAAAKELPIPSAPSHSDTFCLATPVRPLKRSRVREAQIARVESPLKRYKVDARNYFEVGLALPSSIYV